MAGQKGMGQHYQVVNTFNTIPHSLYILLYLSTFEEIGKKRGMDLERIRYGSNVIKRNGLHSHCHVLMCGLKCG